MIFLTQLMSHDGTAPLGAASAPDGDPVTLSRTPKVPSGEPPLGTREGPIPSISYTHDDVLVAQFRPPRSPRAAAVFSDRPAPLWQLPGHTSSTRSAAEAAAESHDRPLRRISQVVSLDYPRRRQARAAGASDAGASSDSDSELDGLMLAMLLEACKDQLADDRVPSPPLTPRGSTLTYDQTYFDSLHAAARDAFATATGTDPAGASSPTGMEPAETSAEAAADSGLANETATQPGQSATAALAQTHTAGHLLDDQLAMYHSKVPSKRFLPKTVKWLFPEEAGPLKEPEWEVVRKQYVPIETTDGTPADQAVATPDTEALSTTDPSSEARGIQMMVPAPDPSVPARYIRAHPFYPLGHILDIRKWVWTWKADASPVLLQGWIELRSMDLRHLMESPVPPVAPADRSLWQTWDQKAVWADARWGSAGGGALGSGSLPHDLPYAAVRIQSEPCLMPPSPRLPTQAETTQEGTEAPRESLWTPRPLLMYPHKPGQVLPGCLYRSQCLEDKWDLFLDENNFLYAYRAWTGVLQLVVQLQIGDTSASVVRIWVSATFARAATHYPPLQALTPELAAETVGETGGNAGTVPVSDSTPASDEDGAPLVPRLPLEAVSQDPERLGPVDLTSDLPGAHPSCVWAVQIADFLIKTHLFGKQVPHPPPPPDFFGRTTVCPPPPPGQEPTYSVLDAIGQTKPAQQAGVPASDQDIEFLADLAFDLWGRWGGFICFDNTAKLCLWSDEHALDNSPRPYGSEATKVEFS